MSADRGNRSLWWWLFSRSKYHPPRIDFFKRRIWRDHHFWQDTLWTYLNRILGCKLFGHRRIENISFPGEPKEYFCFNCYRKVNLINPEKYWKELGKGAMQIYYKEGRENVKKT
jgi:hypothetical protein